MIFLLHGSACLFLITLLCVSILASLFKLLLLEFCQVFVNSHLASSESPGIIGQHPPPHWLVLRRSRNEPFSVTSLIWCSPFRHGLCLKNFLTHSQLSTTSYAALVCSLSTGTRIRIAMHGCNSIFRLSFSLAVPYISGVVNSQRAGPEARFTSQFSVLRLRANLQRLPRS